MVSNPSLITKQMLTFYSANTDQGQELTRLWDRMMIEVGTGAVVQLNAAGLAWHVRGPGFYLQHCKEATKQETQLGGFWEGLGPCLSTEMERTPTMPTCT